MFTKHGAKILSSRRWDERRLAYPIEGQQRGTYLLVYFAVDTQAVAAIRRDLQFNESLLRSLLVECAEVPQGAYEPEADVRRQRHPERRCPASAPVVEPRRRTRGAVEATETPPHGGLSHHELWFPMVVVAAVAPRRFVA
jgi:ribosomal protein S6